MLLAQTKVYATNLPGYKKYGRITCGGLCPMSFPSEEEEKKFDMTLRAEKEFFSRKDLFGGVDVSWLE